MTVKRKRAKALPKISLDSTSGFNSGCVVDERFPETEVRGALGSLVDELEWEAFESCLGHHLGVFRSESQPQPTAGDERASVEVLIETTEQLRARIRDLPSGLEANLDRACIDRYGRIFFELRQELEAKLRDFNGILVVAEQGLQKRAAGRTPAHARDRLLHAVAHHLEFVGRAGKEQAALVGGDVLRACGVALPSEIKDLRRIVLRVEHGRGK